MRAASAVAVLLAACALAGAARAESPAARACIAASDRGQELRDQGRLRASAESFAVCSKSECPAMVRSDCATWMREVLELTPSVVIAARDSRGRDLADVLVTVDGKRVAEKLDGRPIELDPGEHAFRFEAAGMPPVEQRFVLREKEKDRPLAITFAGEHATERATGEEPPPPPSFTLSLVLAGAALAGGAVATYLDLSATSEAHDLRAACAPHCGPTSLDGVHAKYLAAAIVGGASVVSLGLGAYFFFEPPRRARGVGVGVGVGVRPTWGGATLAVDGSF